MAFSHQIIGIVGVVLGAILGFLYARHLWKRKAELFRETLQVIMYCDQRILRMIKHCRPVNYENIFPKRDLALGIILEEMGILDRYENHHWDIEGHIKLRGPASIVYRDLKYIDDILLSKIPNHIKLLYGRDVDNLRLNLLSDYRIRGRKLVYRVENDVSEDERIKHSLFQTVLNENYKARRYYEQQEVEFNPNDLKNICQKDKEIVLKEEFERYVHNKACELCQELSDYRIVGIGQEADENFELLKDFIKNQLLNDEDISLNDFLKHLKK